MPKSTYYTSLARLARDPETAAIYSARAQLAARYELRAALASANGYRLARLLPTTRRFMSEAR